MVAVLQQIATRLHSIIFRHFEHFVIHSGLTTFAVMNIWMWGRALVWKAHVEYTDKRRVSWLYDLKKRLTESKGYLQEDEGEHHQRLLVEADRVTVFMISEAMASDQDRIPVSLRIYMKRTGSLPKYIIFLNINEKKVPYVSARNRFKVKSFGYNIFAVNGNFGFMEQPDVRHVLRTLNPKNIIKPDLEKSVIVVNREQFFIDKKAPIWLKIQAVIFKVTLMFGVRAHKYFGLNTEDGLFEVEVPIRISKNGANIKHPEFDLSYSDSNSSDY